MHTLQLIIGNNLLIGNGISNHPEKYLHTNDTVSVLTWINHPLDKFSLFPPKQAITKNDICNSSQNCILSFSSYKKLPIYPEALESHTICQESADYSVCVMQYGRNYLTWGSNLLVRCHIGQGLLYSWSKQIYPRVSRPFV